MSARAPGTPGRKEAGRPLTSLFPPYWPAFAVLGAASILLGLFALFFPGSTLAFAIVMFGIYALVTGAVALVSGIVAGFTHKSWWPGILHGVAGIAAGLLALTLPLATLGALVLIFGLWAITLGVIEIATAIQLRKEIENEWILALAGLLSVLFGFGAIARPGAGAVALVWLLASYALALGFMHLAVAIRLFNAHPKRLASRT